jgi:hypothetical protein
MDVVWIILQLVLAVVYGNLAEWLVHKYILHGLGTRKIAFKKHWHRHHRNCVRHKYRDPDYEGFSLAWDSRWSEIAGLSLLALSHLPFVFVAPAFYGGLVAWCGVYYAVHAVSHVWPKLGKKLFPWHYDHHMGKNQNANWCVTFPLWDWILRTRVVYFN